MDVIEKASRVVASPNTTQSDLVGLIFELTTEISNLRLKLEEAKGPSIKDAIVSTISSIWPKSKTEEPEKKKDEEKIPVPVLAQVKKESDHNDSDNSDSEGEKKVRIRTKKDSYSDSDDGTERKVRIRKESIRSECPRCHKAFTARTLAKYKGICGKCDSLCIKCGEQGKPRGMLRAKGEVIGRICRSCDSGIPKEARKGKKKKKGKEKIRQAIRIKVWDRDIGEDKREGPCAICKKPVRFESFHAAHVISEANGGTTDASNLRVACQSCNISCGTMNLDEFRAKLEK
jgi:hypothetical protein